jgi:hypothetical protein
MKYYLCYLLGLLSFCSGCVTYYQSKKYFTEVGFVNAKEFRYVLITKKGEKGRKYFALQYSKEFGEPQNYPITAEGYFKNGQIVFATDEYANFVNIKEQSKPCFCEDTSSRIWSPFTFCEATVHEKEQDYMAFSNNNLHSPHLFYITINPHRADSFGFYPYPLQAFSQIFIDSFKVLSKKNWDDERIPFLYQGYQFDTEKILEKLKKSDCFNMTRQRMVSKLNVGDTIEWFAVNVCKVWQHSTVGYIPPDWHSQRFFFKPKSSSSFFCLQTQALGSLGDMRKGLYIPKKEQIRFKNFLNLVYTFYIPNRHSDTEPLRKIRYYPKLKISPKFKKQILHCQKKIQLYEAYQAQQLEYEQLIKNKK